MTRLLPLLLALLLAGPAAAQPPAHVAPENAALALAALDSRTLPAADALFTRWIWFDQQAVYEDAQAVTLAANLFSSSPNLHAPAPIGAVLTPPLAQPRPILLRVNLKLLALKDADVNRLVKTWEEFAFDPRFSLLLTRDTLKFAAGVGVDVAKLPRQKRLEWVLDEVPEYLGRDGKRYNAKWVRRLVEVDAKDVDVVRLASEHLDQAALAELIGRTQSQAPVVSFRYFVARSMASIKDKGVFAAVWGGLYYDLLGVPANSKKGTDLDNLLVALGINDVKFAEKRNLLDEFPSDQRAAMFRSDVTGKPRLVESIRSRLGRIWITSDIARQDVDVGNHAVMNLVQFTVAAHESMWDLPNGLVGYALHDGRGKLQEAAPSNVVADRTVPSPHSLDLHSPISCLRCHLREDGWRRVHNDVPRLVRSRRFDIFGDLNLANASREEVARRLSGLYAGDFERELLPEARNAYARAVLKTTGPWRGGKGDQTDVVRLAHEQIGKVWNDYFYVEPDARQALADLGIPLRADRGLLAQGVTLAKDPLAHAAVQLGGLLPPVAVKIDDIPPEDPRIIALIEGLAVPRTDYDLIFAFMARRVQLALTAQKK